jgi:uncharacterized HAD superfamily protein
MNYKTLNCLSNDSKKNLYKIHNDGYDLIVGIPRSGMIPAYMIGLYLNLNVIDLDGYIDNRKLKKGLTRKAKVTLNYSHDAEKVLIIDDSIMSGASLKNAINSLPKFLVHKSRTLAIYSDRKERSDVDIFFEVVESPRVFEWNLFHRNLMASACLDIDGVLCHDPSDRENDDGEMYLRFLDYAKPLMIPTYKVHSLVTNRLEKYRVQTERWLEKHGVDYEYLIMLDLPSKEERQKMNSYAVHKSTYFKNNRELQIFIESDISQARDIAKISGKPVYCMDDNCFIELFQ